MMQLRYRVPAAILAAVSLLPVGALAGDKKKKDPEEIGNRRICHTPSVELPGRSGPGQRGVSPPQGQRGDPETGMPGQPLSLEAEGPGRVDPLGCDRPVRDEVRLHNQRRRGREEPPPF